MRAYLLGQASEADAERIEVRALEDEDFFMEVRSAEDDLFDDYARGLLSAAEREQFLARYGHAHDRLPTAEALAARVARANASAPSPPVFRTWMLAAAAALVAGVGAVLWMRAPSTVSTTMTSVAPSQLSSSLAPAPAPVVLALTLGASRAAASVPEATLSGSAPALALRVRIDPADTFADYSMEIRSTTGALVWSREHLAAANEHGDRILAGEIPSASLPAGTYEVAVRGITSGAPPETLGFATMSIRR